MKTKEELIEMLGEDRIEELFEALKLSAEHIQDEVVLIKSHWKTLKRQEVAGTIDQDNLDVGYAKVRQKLLNIIKTVDAPPPDSHSPTNRETTTFISKTIRVEQQKPQDWPKAENANKTKPSAIWKYTLIALAGAVVLFIVLSRFAKKSAQATPNSTEKEIGKAHKDEAPTTVLPESTTKPETTRPEVARRPILRKTVLKVAREAQVQFLTSSRKVGYEVTGAQLEPIGGNEAALNIKINCSNKGAYPLNFWNSSFRLEVDGAKRRLSPVGELNQVVAARADAEGEVSFTVPTTAKGFTLYIQDFDQEKAIRLDIPE